MEDGARTARDKRSDSTWTIGAVGVLAYVGETIGHELIGHGGACLLSGGRITALAPLWMRCSVQTVPMVAAGPLFNFVATAAFATVLRMRRKADVMSYLLWLSCAFNLLVACGYLMVAGATTFGDWGVVFAHVRPEWVWRISLVCAGLAGYFFGLRLLGRLYPGVADGTGIERRTLRRRTLLPGACAALVACAAEVIGGRVAAGSLVLALGCTLFVGWSLGWIRQGRRRALPVHDALTMRFSWGWIAGALLVAAAFVALVGPVATLGG